MSKNAAIAVIDFDHTLFNTSDFLNALCQAAKLAKVTKARFYRTFSAVTDGMHDSPYSFDSHLSALELPEKDAKRLRSDFTRIVRRSAEFVYADVRPFLRKLRTHPVDVALLTFADQRLREQQLKATGLLSLLDSVHIVPHHRSGKRETLAQLVTGYPYSILVDDHPQVLRMLDGLTRLSIRLRRRVLRRYHACEPLLLGTPVFPDLTQAYTFLFPILRSLSTHRSSMVN